MRKGEEIMSCEECNNNAIEGAFYRWKNANVEIIACRKHWLEIREALNKAQADIKEKK